MVKAVVLEGTILVVHVDVPFTLSAHDGPFCDMELAWTGTVGLGAIVVDVVRALLKSRLLTGLCTLRSIWTVQGLVTSDLPGDDFRTSHANDVGLEKNIERW